MPINSFDNYPMSWKPMLTRGKEPLYIKLAKQLENDISNGILKPGTKLPPQRELADFLDVNLSTISRAFRICSDKGLLSGNIGRGTYVAYDVVTRITSAISLEKRQMIELGVMMPEMVRQIEINELLQEMIKEVNYERFFTYSIHVDPWQREAAARLFYSIGCDVKGEQICFSSGAQNGLAAIFAGLFKSGDRIGVDPLVYPGLKSAAKLFGIKLVPIVQDNMEMTESGLLYAIKNYGIKGIYIMPDSQNPIEHIMSEDCRSMIARIAEKYNLIVIEDNMDRLLQSELCPTVYSRIPEQTIYILSLSKAINPALRLAYMAVPKQYLNQIDNALYNINLSQSALLLEISSRLIVSNRLEEVLKKRCHGLEIRNQVVNERLCNYEVWGNQRSLGRWLLLPNSITGIEFEKKALEKGVIVYGSERFAVGKDAPVGAVRLAICAPESVEKLKQGLDVILKLLKNV